MRLGDFQNGGLNFPLRYFRDFTRASTLQAHVHASLLSNLPYVPLAHVVFDYRGFSWLKITAQMVT